MSVGLDKMYVNMISGRLQRFSWSRDRLAICRCPFCGDSAKSQRKRRFYVYQDVKHGKDHLSVTCHNCLYGGSFYGFLEEFAPDVFQSYRMDLFRERGFNPERRKVDFKSLGLGRGMMNRQTEASTDAQAVDEVQTAYDALRPTPDIGDCDRLSLLPYDHPATRYAAWRRIPEAAWGRLFFTETFRDTVKELGLYVDEDTDLPNDARLLIPFFGADKELIAVQGRAMAKDAGIRYITIKRDEDSQKIFGMDMFNPKLTPLIVEGPIDSLFLPNCVATADANLLSANLDGIYIPDNQPRNVGVIKSMSRIIAAGKRIVIWPKNLPYKDINDMIKDGGLSVRDVVTIIAQNNFKGLKAQMQFTQWKKVATYVSRD